MGEWNTAEHVMQESDGKQRSAQNTANFWQDLWVAESYHAIELVHDHTGASGHGLVLQASQKQGTQVKCGRAF